MSRRATRRRTSSKRTKTSQSRPQKPTPRLKKKSDRPAGPAAIKRSQANAVASGSEKPIFKSPPVSKQTPGHAVAIDVPLGAAKQLYLVVTDAGNGFSCDWADWAEPRLVGPKGEKKLTDLQWKDASAQWGKVRVNKNAGGGPLKIAGNAVAYGIGTHANSLIAFDLPEGYDRFVATGGLDNGGTDQSGGDAAEVEFLVYTAKPALPTKGRNEASGSHEVADALDGLDVGDGLAATLFAAEPQLLSPSNIDIDHRGRVWVCEIVNYRRHQGKRAEGDRILILEDSDGDGQADTETVFYQGTDIDSPHGVCVLGDKVIVSAGDKVLLFTDSDGDDKPDDKQVLFSGISGTQHDHG
ncbi:PVC-type heme-binding CxxCH protein, partial [Novipirellula sp.]|uniref:PVC-type heme-binding CxxCH protein n=1 Tax=Novipirellula sp. TaxID=2795430 RepID=UPI0035695E32